MRIVRAFAVRFELPRPRTRWIRAEARLARMPIKISTMIVVAKSMGARRRVRSLRESIAGCGRPGFSPADSRNSRFDMEEGACAPGSCTWEYRHYQTLGRGQRERPRGRPAGRPAGLRLSHCRRMVVLDQEPPRLRPGVDISPGPAPEALMK